MSRQGHSSGRGRRSRLLFLGGIVGIGLAACSPATEGAVGITRGADGRLVAVVESCSKPIDSLVISRVDTPGYVGQWSPVSAASGRAEVSLQGASPGWRTVVPPAEFEPTQTYKMVAGATSADTTYRTRPLFFRGDDLAGVSPGLVLVGAPGSEDDPQRLVAVGEFAGAAC